jgi:hypothetical protein
VQWQHPSPDELYFHCIKSSVLTSLLLPAGRAGYGWVLFDLTSGRLAARGCMSLRYRQSAGQAEFEGLLAGLAAAKEARVTSLAVQVGADGGGRQSSTGSSSATGCVILGYCAQTARGLLVCWRMHCHSKGV